MYKITQEILVLRSYYDCLGSLINYFLHAELYSLIVKSLFNHFLT